MSKPNHLPATVPASGCALTTTPGTQRIATRMADDLLAVARSRERALAAGSMTFQVELVLDSPEIQIHRKLKDGLWQIFIVTFKFYPNKGKFPIGWNGSRFAAGSEYDKLNKFSPKTLKFLEIFLRENFSSDKNERKLILQNKGVTKLIHFTNEKNLESIMTHGLCVRNSFQHKNIQPRINDQIRLDGYLDAISLSISFPNSKMFYKYRMANPNESWVVLMLSPSLLWEMSCAFCKHNAADARIRLKNKSELSNSKSLNEMFDEMIDLESRKSQYLNDFDPTDVQAEVLVFGEIHPSRIMGVAFNKREAQAKYEALMKGKESLLYLGNQGYFSDRLYHRKLQLGK